MTAVQGAFDVMTAMAYGVGTVAQWSGMSHLCAEIAPHAPDWMKRVGEQIKCDVQWIARRVEVVTTGPLGELQKAAWEKCVDEVKQYISQLDLSSLKSSIPSEQELDVVFKAWQNLVPKENEVQLTAFNQRLVFYREERAALQRPLNEAHSCAQRVALVALGLVVAQAVRA